MLLAADDAKKQQFDITFTATSRIGSLQVCLLKADSQEVAQLA